MSKIICDICGTVYPDNATVCPICGYPRQDHEKIIPEEAPSGAVPAAAAPKSVKGGRFSSKNVKKRNRADTTGNGRPSRGSEEPEDGNPNRILLIVVAILAVAVVALGIYIGTRFLLGAGAYDKAESTKGSAPAVSTTEATTVPEDTSVACVGMTVSDSSVWILSEGRAWLLEVSVQPENTTDELVFTSSDETVAKVTPEGRITAVGPGTAVITITCGEVSKECVVNCDFAEETEPSETTEETTQPTETTEATEQTKPETTDFQLDHSDVTLFSKGEAFTLSGTNNGSYLSPAQISWSTSNAEVAKVENGKVTATGSGMCTISATYDGQTQKCIVRCNFKDEETEPTETTEDSSSGGNWSISSSDVTIAVGESFTLKITNDAGETASVSWSASTSGVVSVDGNTVTGQASGQTTLSATVDGQTFQCIVRVK